MWVRNIGVAGSPDASANPGKGSENHVDHRAQREDLHGAVARGETPKIDREQTVGKSQDGPGDEAGGEKRTRKPQKAEDGYGGEESESYGTGEVALEGEPFKAGKAIGGENPGDKNEREADAGVHTGADGRILEEMQPAIAREVSAHGNHREGSQTCTKIKPGAMKKVA